MRFKIKNAKSQKREIEVDSVSDVIQARAEGKINAPDALAIFRTVVAKEFPPEKIKGMIEDLARANDKKSTKDGGFYTTPNWNARYRGFKEIMAILGIASDGTAPAGGMQPTRVQLNVIQHNQIPERVEKL